MQNPIWNPIFIALCFTALIVHIEASSTSTIQKAPEKQIVDGPQRPKNIRTPQDCMTFEEVKRSTVRFLKDWGRLAKDSLPNKEQVLNGIEKVTVQVAPNSGPHVRERADAYIAAVEQIRQIVLPAIKESCNVAMVYTQPEREAIAKVLFKWKNDIATLCGDELSSLAHSVGLRIEDYSQGRFDGFVRRVKEGYVTAGFRGSINAVMSYCFDP